MKFLTANHLKRLLSVVVVIAFFYFAYRLTNRSKFYERVLNERIKENYSGKIVEKYIDSKEHNTPYLKLTDTTISIENVIYFKVRIGDSIVKKSGSQFVNWYDSSGKESCFDYKKHFDELKNRKSTTCNQN